MSSKHIIVACELNNKVLCLEIYTEVHGVAWPIHRDPYMDFYYTTSSAVELMLNSHTVYCNNQIYKYTHRILLSYIHMFEAGEGS